MCADFDPPNTQNHILPHSHPRESLGPRPCPAASCSDAAARRSTGWWKQNWDDRGETSRCSSRGTHEVSARPHSLCDPLGIFWGAPRGRRPACIDLSRKHSTRPAAIPGLPTPKHPPPSAARWWPAAPTPPALAQAARRTRPPAPAASSPPCARRNRPRGRSPPPPTPGPCLRRRGPAAAPAPPVCLERGASLGGTVGKFVDVRGLREWAGDRML